MANSEMDFARRNVEMRCCICILVMIAFPYLALDGHHTKINLLFPGSTFGNPLDEINDNTTWMHGWPVACSVRNSPSGLVTILVRGGTSTAGIEI